jgi:hypothetical protein
LKSDVKKKMTSFSHSTATPKSLAGIEEENFARVHRREWHAEQSFVAYNHTTPPRRRISSLIDFIATIFESTRLLSHKFNFFSRPASII